MLMAIPEKNINTPGRNIHFNWVFLWFIITNKTAAIIDSIQMNHVVDQKDRSHFILSAAIEVGDRLGGLSVG